MTKLHELHELGQSVWLDYIRRDLIDNGELRQMVADGIRGLTSNPTIFQKAIAGTDLYDDRIRTALADLPDGAGADQLFERLAIADIRDAADILRPVYEEAGGHDGLVSFEVSPHLAYDTEGTVSEAHRLWAEIDRPNLMIKVPATPQGYLAIERLIADGINVNATLMFSLAHYEGVAQAFVRGVNAASAPGHIASVASFFVSRVDTKVDAALDKIGTPEALELRGKIAVANSKLAYRRYQEIFEGDDFATASARGGRPQRVLWASTSTKNPEYRDVLYVEELIAPNTVNTMPPATLEAFLDHGEIRGLTALEAVDEAAEQVARLADLGIDFDEITETLQTEGVQAFSDSYDELLSAISRKAEALR